MKYFKDPESGQMTLLGLGMVLLILGIIIIVFIYSPLGKQIFGMRGPLSKKYTIVGIIMAVLGLILAQRGMRNV